jgi:hypothetical protein
LSDDKLAVIVTTRIQVDQRVTLTITGRGPGGRALLFGNPATGPTATLHRVAPAGSSQLRVLVPVMRNHLVAGKAYDVSVVATGSGGQRSAPLVFAFRAP